MNNNNTLQGPAQSDVTTLAMDRNNGGADYNEFKKQQPGFRKSEDDGSISNCASTYEYREKVIKILTKEYGPHVQRLKHAKSGSGKVIRISRT